MLEVTLHLRYQQTLVSQGPPRYCYVTDDGLESPTLRVYPGDQLIIHLHNDLPEWTGYRPPQHAMPDKAQPDDCHASAMDPAVTNLHFHGMTIPPTCHQDDVIRTAVPAGGEFDYRVTIPRDEPPGLYWYHPHPHGYSERQVQGGASGALIVEGIQGVFPSLASMPERVLVLRDEQRIGPEAPAPGVPAWDLSANFVPVTYSEGKPATIVMRPGQKEFWRVLNGGADVILNLQFLADHIAQPLQVVAIDGVPLPKKAITTQTNIFLPPGARAEFVVGGPEQGQNAQLITEAWDTGPQGDNDTRRTIADVVTSTSSPALPAWVADQRAAIPYVTSGAEPNITGERRLYFSQRSSNAADPDSFVLYFVTVAGQIPQAYKMGLPPNIVLHRGAVEDWTIENRSPEDHVFHIHQIHFRVLEVNGKPVNDATLRDTIDVPYWTGEGPYPSVKLRMDFRDPNIVGTFVYHCHILKHEDMGMMGSIQVLPPGVPTTTRLTLPRTTRAGDSVTLAANVERQNATGTVTFVVDGLDEGRPIALSGGRATFVTSFADPGQHTIRAFYSGDSKYNESATPRLTLNVRP